MQYLTNIISDNAMLQTFQLGDDLPHGYGFRLDARVVEIPWVVARLPAGSGRLLDAGSSLNHESILKAPVLTDKRITIVTLAPEDQSYWRLGISYVFGDLRDLDFQDSRFEVIVCISTIEHIGMDNSMYTGQRDLNNRQELNGFIPAMQELKRVLTPGGMLYITFPFGQYENHGWFQQFDSQLADRLIEAFGPSQFSETIFRYDPDGWQLSDRNACRHCKFFDVHKTKYFDRNSTIEYASDYPAGERAVACLGLCK